jgi:leucyl/phenylalanyl-tRNA--protein transferase
VLGRELFFPPVIRASREGLLAIGGDLSVPRLLLAYQSGIFPWPSEGLPLLWFAPPQRAVIEPDKLHVGRSLRKVVDRGVFEVRYDTAFAEVIEACAGIPRRHEAGTWILPEMIDAYIRLHEAGFAHSVESWKDGQLVGGLYGVSLGGCFFGESMFARTDDASKVAFVVLARRLHAWGFHLIDCQVQNEHLERFGVSTIPRAEFQKRLHAALELPTRRGLWTLPSRDPDPERKEESSEEGTEERRKTKRTGEAGTE